VFWRRREPIGAVILIALGLLILLHQLDWFSGRIFEYSWPVVLIGLGVWLMVRRLSETKGSSQENSKEGQP
jgi:putative Mn2+ efflux pump MntP